MTSVTLRRVRISVVLVMVFFGPFFACVAAGPLRDRSSAVETDALPTLVVQTGSQSLVGTIACSKDGRFVLTNDWTGTIVWEASTGRQIRHFPAAETRSPTLYFCPVGFSPDGQAVLETGTSYVRRVDVRTGKGIWILTSKEIAENDRHLHFGPLSSDGTFAIVIGDKRVYFLDAQTGKQLRSFAIPPPRRFVRAVSFDGKLLLACESQHSDKHSRARATLLDGFTGKQIAELTPPSEILSADFSRDGKLLLAGGQDGIARLWDTATGNQMAALRHDGQVTCVAFAADGTKFLTAQTGWGRLEPDLDSDDLKAEPGLRDAEPRRPDDEHQSRPEDRKEIAVAPEMERFQSGPFAGPMDPSGPKKVRPHRAVNKLFLWNIESTSYPKGFDIFPTHVISPWAMFTPDSRFILTAGRSHPILDMSKKARTAILWEPVSGGRQVQRFEGHSSPIDTFALSLSRDGRFLATADVDGEVQLWDLASGREFHRLKRHDFNMGITLIKRLAFSPNSKLLLTLGQDGQASMWDTTTGRELHRFGNTAFISAADFSTDGTRVIAQHSFVRSEWESVSGRQVVSAKSESVNQFNVLGFSPDGRYMMTGVDNKFISPKGASVALWNVREGREVWTAGVAEGTADAVEFSPSGRFALTRGASVFGLSSSLFDIAKGRLLAHFDRESAMFASDDTLVVIAYENPVASASNTIASDTGLRVRRFRHPYSGFRVGACSLERHFAIAFSPYGGTRVCDLDDGHLLCDLVSFSDGSWAAVNSEGRYDTNQIDSLAGLSWILPDQPMRPLAVDIFMRDYYEPQLLSSAIEHLPFRQLRQLVTLNRAQPEIKIVNVVQQAAKGDLVTVEVQVTNVKSDYQTDSESKLLDSGAYDLRLFRDGKLVGQEPSVDDEYDGGLKFNRGNDEEFGQDLKMWRKNCRIALGSAGRTTLRFTDVRIPCDRTRQTMEFSAYAFNNDRVKSATAKYDYKVPHDIGRRGRRAFLIAVGVNEYQNPAWNLRFAGNDGKVFRDVVSTSLSASGAFEEVVPILLISDRRAGQPARNLATKNNIKEALQLLSGRIDQPRFLQDVPNAGRLSKVLPDDLVLLFFSGHGTMRNDKFYFLPSDIGESETSSGVTRDVLQHSISSDEFATWLKAVDAGDLVLILDACDAASAVAATQREFKPAPLGNRGLGQLAYDKGMRLLAASQSLSPAQEHTTLTQSLLTQALVIEAIEQCAVAHGKEGRVTIGKWLQNAVERVPKLADALKTPEQAPMLFAFVRRREDLPVLQLRSCDRASGLSPPAGRNGD